MHRTHAARRIARAHARFRMRRWARRPTRPVGAPRGNLNAIRHGADAHPLSTMRLEQLAAAIAARPGDLATHLLPAIRDIQDRAPDDYRALVAVRVLAEALIDLIADNLFRQELRQALQPLPSPARERYCEHIQHLAARMHPQERLSFLRKKLHDRKQFSSRRQTLDSAPPP
jgi:hypothetical protein